MTNNKVRAIIIDSEENTGKRAAIVELVKEIGIDDYKIIKASEEEGKLRRSLSNHIARNDQKIGYYTLILSDNAILTGDRASWDHYIDNLPAEKDYDILLFSDCICQYTSTPFPKEKEYNRDFLHLPHPCDIGRAPAYIVSPAALERLNAHPDLILSAEDYLNYCINEYKLVALVAKESLFTTGPEGQKQTGEPGASKLLFYTKMWDMDEKLTGIPRKKGFELLSDPGRLDEADVVVFHMPTLSREDAALKKGQKKPGQRWVFWSMECEKHYLWQYEPEIAGLFDITMTYKIDSDIPVPYIDPVYIEWLRRPPLVKTSLVNAFISGDVDQSGRIALLRELMRYLDVHSYGKTLNNMRLDQDSGISSKATKIAGYKFSIAFENAIAKDYVTEKFFHPLIMGSIPVYLGAPNINEFAPGDHCYINVNDFASVKALADYLHWLDNDDAGYQAYYTWKTLPFRQAYLYRANTMLRHPFIRLYELIGDRLR